MKISIIGYSGSGKSTLARKLGNLLNCDYLYIDTINFLPGWKEVSKADREKRLDNFLSTHEDWVIDGNYFETRFDERMKESDLIIFMDFNRITCYKNAKRRAHIYRHIARESAPEGCEENFSLSFRWWILYTGRTYGRKKVYKKTLKQYSNKFVRLTNYQDVDMFLDEFKNKYINK